MQLPKVKERETSLHSCSVKTRFPVSTSTGSPSFRLLDPDASSGKEDSACILAKGEATEAEYDPKAEEEEVVPAAANPEELAKAENGEAVAASDDFDASVLAKGVAGVGGGGRIPRGASIGVPKEAGREDRVEGVRTEELKDNLLEVAIGVEGAVEPGRRDPKVDLAFGR